VIGPAVVLAAVIGLFHVSAYVFIRGHAGARLPLLVVAAILGAWAGDTVGARMAIDPFRIGEFHLLSASFVSWLGIALVAVLAVLVPERRDGAGRAGVSTVLKRSTAATQSTDRPAKPSHGAEPEPQAPR
jgi:drug/metabolite transporter (DMT)-like permease